jgi:hypothetical protein
MMRGPKVWAEEHVDEVTTNRAAYDAATCWAWSHRATLASLALDH